MLTKHATVRVFRPIGWIVLAGTMILGISGCAGTPFAPTGGGPYATEQAVAHGFDNNESDHRQLKQELGAIKDAMDSNSEKMQNLVDDLNKQLRQQQQTLDKIQTELQSSSRSAAPAPSNVTPSPAAGPAPTPLPQNPTYAQALNNGKVLFDQKNFAGAAASFRTAQGLAQDKEQKTQANYWLGEVAFGQNDYPAATQAYQAAITRDNADSPTAWLSFERLGDLDRAQGNNAAALQKYNTILSEHARYHKPYEREAEVKAKIAEIQGGGGGAAPSGPAPGGASVTPGAAPAGPGEFGQSVN